VVVSRDTEPPTVCHLPVREARAGRPIEVTATVRDPSGIAWVRLRYRPVNQTTDYRTLPMTPTDAPGRFRAVVPAEHVPPAWDFMYFIETADRCGNGRIWPDLETTAPYVVVRLKR